MNALNIKKLVYTTLAGFIAIYVLSAYMSPLDPETLIKYNLSEVQARLLTVSILLPVIFIWIFASYGFVHFKQYAMAIKGTPQGKGTNTIANGLGLIALQLFVSSSYSIASSTDRIKDALGGERGVQIISNNIDIFFALAIGLVLFQGANQLNASLEKPTKPKVISASFYALLLVSIAFLGAIIYAYHGNSAETSIYRYLPLSAALVSIGVPYIIVWNFYLLTARHLLHYRRRAVGSVYKRELTLLTNAILLILGGSVLVQLLNTVGGFFNNLSLLPLLAVLYSLIGLIGLGFLFIARAANQLRNIEN